MSNFELNGSCARLASHLSFVRQVQFASKHQTPSFYTRVMYLITFVFAFLLHLFRCVHNTHLSTLLFLPICVLKPSLTTTTGFAFEQLTEYLILPFLSTVMKAFVGNVPDVIPPSFTSASSGAIRNHDSPCFSVQIDSSFECCFILLFSSAHI